MAKCTCLTNDDILECLKYLGKTISSKALKLCILKELMELLPPELPLLTLTSFQSIEFYALSDQLTML